MDYESVLMKINGTSTDDRKEGIREFLEVIKGHVKNDFDVTVKSETFEDFLKDKIKCENLFKGLGRLLRDPDWEIKRDTLEVIMSILLKEISPNLIDVLLSPVMPHVISCLSDHKMTVRKSATQCIHELWIKSHDLTRCLQTFIECGLHRSISLSQRRDNNSALKLLLTSHFASSDLSPIIDAVILQLELDPDDERLIGIVNGVLCSIKKLIGEEPFSRYLEQADSSIASLYQKYISGLDSLMSASNSRNTSVEPHRPLVSDTRNSSVESKNSTNNTKNSQPEAQLTGTNFFMTAVPLTNNFHSKKPSLQTGKTADPLYLGFIPASIVADIENEKKLEAIEEIYNLFSKLSRNNQLGPVIPFVPDLIQLIKQLMEDKQLVIMKVYKLLTELVSSLQSEQVNRNLDSLLQLLRMTLSYNINGNIIVQTCIMTYSMVLFQKSNTKELLTKLCDQHFMADMKQASVRQTSIDIITSALLKFPSYTFDLDFLTTKISQRLTDRKQKVKQAALECISVIGYTYGNGKVNTMLKIVEQVTKTDSSNAITELVQARLSKHRFPHVDDHEMVVYVGDIEKNNNQRQYSIIDLENSSSDNSPISSANALEKRRPSAGKVRGRAKFPWDQNEGNNQTSGPFTKALGITSLNQIQPSDSIPIQFSHGSISVNNKQMIHDGKNIKRLNELQNDNDHDGNSSRNHNISGRSNSSEFSPSTNTSGYSSNSNSSRRYTEFSIKPNQESVTATNSVNVTPRNPPTSRFEDINVVEQSPIPTKPTLGRSAGSRRKELDLSNQIPRNNDGPKVEIIETINSTMLDSVRNSAAKKKAMTIFNSSSQKSSQNNGQSNIDQSSKTYSSPLQNGTKNSSENSTSNNASEAAIAFNPYKGASFKPNPRYDGLIVGKSVSSPSVDATEPLKKKQPVKGIHHLNYRSFSLAQMTEYNISDNDSASGEFSDGDRNIPNMFDNVIEKDAKYLSNTNPSVGRLKMGRDTPLSSRYTSVPCVGIEETLTNPSTSRIEFNIVGKSMFDATSGNVSQRQIVNHQYSDSKKSSTLTTEAAIAAGNVPVNSDSPRNSKVTTSRTSNTSVKEIDFSEGIVGKGIVDRNGPEDESDEELNKGIMSNTLRESLSIKRQKAANELNSSKPESNLSLTAPSPHSAPGSGSYQTVNRKPPVGGYYHNNTLPSSAGNERDVINGYDTVPPSRKPLRPALGNSTPKKVKPLSQTLTNPPVNPPIDPTNVAPVPLSNPDKSIIEFHNLIQNEDWETKITALIIVQSLAQYHGEILTSRPTELHSLCIAICRECKNLRSQVAKCAIQTVGSLFTNLRKTMDSELDIIIVNMLSKGGDASSIFLRQDVEQTLSVMIENVTPQRAVIPLITNGADNKNTAIRRLAASIIMQITEKLGSVKILAGAKEITEKLLLVVGKFVMDSNQETRYFAKRILLELCKNPDLEKIANKTLAAKDVRILNEAIENIKLKGIGDPPQFSQSASIRRSGSISRGASAGNLVSLEQKASTLSRGNSRSMSRLPGSELSADDDDWLSKTCSDLSSSDFRSRQNGLESLLARQESFGLQIPQRGLSKLLNEFIPRLNDNNSKVAVTALNVCRLVVPSICSIFPTEFISRLINTIALNFASKSNELKESASIVMNVCFSNFDSNLLVQPCVEAMNKANVKSKPVLIDNMNNLLLSIINSKTSVTSRSSGAITRHVAPQIGLLLEQNRPLPLCMRDSLQKLVSLSYQIVGPDLIDAATRERSHVVRQILVDILNTQNHGVT